MSNYAVYFPNTDLIQEVIADGWDMPDPDKVTFFKGKWHEHSKQYIKKADSSCVQHEQYRGIQKNRGLKR